GLGVAEVTAGLLRVLMERAARAGRETGAVEEEARAVDQAGAPVVFLLVDALPDAAPLADLLELPVVLGELLRQALDPAHALLVGRVRAVGAAAVDQLGRGLGEHALTSLSEDAGVVRREVGHVDLPLPFLLARDRDGDPFTGGCGGHRAQANARR